MSRSITFNGINLTRKCHLCRGYGSVYVEARDEESEETIDCGECAGLGCHFTDAGLRLKDFIHLVEKAVQS